MLMYLKDCIFFSFLHLYEINNAEVLSIVFQVSASVLCFGVLSQSI